MSAVVHELALRAVGFGSLSAVQSRARRTALLHEVARTLADGGPIEDEIEAAEQVIETIERFLLPERSGRRQA